MTWAFAHRGAPDAVLRPARPSATADRRRGGEAWARPASTPHTRPGDRGFSASIQVGDFVNPRGRPHSGSHAGLTGLRATQVPGNAMRAADGRLSDIAPNRPGLATPRIFATHPSGPSIGTACVAGTLRVAGIPTSIAAGTYVARVALTAI